jgi:hypothetical protein
MLGPYTVPAPNPGAAPLWPPANGAPPALATLTIATCAANLRVVAMRCGAFPQPGSAPLRFIPAGSPPTPINVGGLDLRNLYVEASATTIVSWTGN